MHVVASDDDTPRGAFRPSIPPTVLSLAEEEPVLELDLDVGPAEEAEATAEPSDDGGMEFDPISGRDLPAATTADLGGEIATELELPSSGASLIPPVPMPSTNTSSWPESGPTRSVSELNFDFPLEDEDAAPLVPPQPALPSFESSTFESTAVDLGLDVAPALSPARSARREELPVPRLTSGEAVPDLEVRPRKRSSDSGRSRAVGSSKPPPSLALDYGSRPQATDLSRSERRSSIPPTGRPSVRPRVSEPPGQSELGSLDDLGFGGRAAQLDVAVALPKPDGEVKWPLGRSPYDDELNVSADAILQNGYGPVPSSLLAAPFYAISAMRMRSGVESKRRAAEAELKNAEQVRDERLAALARELRPAIEKQERFSALFAQVEALNAEVKERSDELESLDRGSATEMKNLQRGVDQYKARSAQAQAARDQLALTSKEQNRTVARLEAALKRLLIEERNLDDRLEASGISKAEYLAAESDLQSRRAQTQNELGLEKRAAARLSAQLSELENAVRVAYAEQQTQEGALETHLIAIEGDSAERSAALLEVRRMRTEQLAQIGRAVVELRGSIGLEPAVRAELLKMEERVLQAALRAKTMKLAAESLDRASLAVGRAMIVFGVVLLLAFTVYLFSK